MGIQKKVTRDRIPKPIKSDQSHSKFIISSKKGLMSGIFPEDFGKLPSMIESDRYNFIESCSI